jgi:hypothetical protein
MFSSKKIVAGTSGVQYIHLMSCEVLSVSRCKKPLMWLALAGVDMYLYANVELPLATQFRHASVSLIIRHGGALDIRGPKYNMDNSVYIA